MISEPFSKYTSEKSNNIESQVVINSTATDLKNVLKQELL